ncbi:MAG: MBL fold metallo-hydrolase [Candidatus Pacebacteria bacterium]|nr:MBL fold metallo-hydrolase [Candidatus Paceibacterota bacterium]
MEIKRLVVGELFTNCYLLYSKGELLVIDPGGEPERILEEIKKYKVFVKYIVNTHKHFDHILGNEKIKRETTAKVLENLKEGDEIKIGEVVLKIIETPGHAKESICLIGNNFIFTGDTLFKDGVGRVDLPGGSEKELEYSRERLFKMIKKGMEIYPGHGESFKRNNA